MLTASLMVLSPNIIAYKFGLTFMCLKIDSTATNYIRIYLKLKLQPGSVAEIKAPKANDSKKEKD